MIPLLVPRSQQENAVLHSALRGLPPEFQIREIDDSPTTPGDLVFPSLGVSALLMSGRESMEDKLICVEKILLRRQCLLLVPQEMLKEAQLRIMMEFDFNWGFVLGFSSVEELTDVIIRFVRGMTSANVDCDV